jgi:tetratricopeptide (TPR) repeat protein
MAIQARLALSGAAERAATLGSLDQAVTYLNQAIAITADPGERAALFLRAARSANDAALHAQAEHLAQAAIDLARSIGDLQAAGAGEALLGDILIDWGRTPEAAEVLEAAVAAYPESGTGEVRATLLASLSRALMRTGRSAEAVEKADLALDLAEHLGLDRIIAETFNNKGSALGYLGRRREALVLLKASIEAAHAGGFVAAETRAMSNFGAQSEDVRESAEMLHAAAELARRVGNRNMANWASVASRFGNLMLADGWDQVIEDSSDEHSDDQDSPQDAIRRLAVLGFFLAPRGDSFDQIIDRIAQLVDQVSDDSAPGSLHFARAQRALIDGDYGLSIDEALLAAEDSALRRIYLSGAMRPALWARDLDRARYISSLLDAVPATGIDVDSSRAAGRAGVAALEGRIDEAVSGYREAFEGFRLMNAPYLAASFQLDMVVLMPDHPAAREAAAEARPILERIKARAWLKVLDDALAGSSTRASDVPESAAVRR